jgi:multicomponent K+:H+ antiporter subunit D
VRVIEIAPVVALLLLCVVLTVEAKGAMRFIQAATGGPQQAQGYLHGVLAQEPVALPQEDVP